MQYREYTKIQYVMEMKMVKTSQKSVGMKMTIANPMAIQVRDPRLNTASCDASIVLYRQVWFFDGKCDVADVKMRE